MTPTSWISRPTTARRPCAGTQRSRHARRHRHQQRPARSRRLEQGDALHPVLLPGGLPILYLQNTTGYIVGKASEEAGMIKHGSKMIQAVANANVPQITLMCGASFGAGNYGMCGRAYDPRFPFSWPNAQTAVMGAEQAALTMAIVMEGGARRKGLPVDDAKIQDLKKRIIENFERQQSAFITSG
jgi:geranyl-CoA carboxylase beta subunit